MAAYTARLTGNPPFCIYLGVAVLKIVACYIRVSRLEESQALQKREINLWLKSNRINLKSVRWYIDKATDKRRQSKLAGLQTDIDDNKVRAVVVWHLDRLSLSRRDRLSILIDWCEKSLRVVSVGQQLDVNPGDCKLISSVLRGVTENDPMRWRHYTKTGKAAARARGRFGGRPQIPADHPKVLKAKKLAAKGKEPAEIAKALDIARSTAYRYVNR